MTWTSLPTTTKILEGLGIAIGFVWLIYKKEILDLLNSTSKKLLNFFYDLLCRLLLPSQSERDKELALVLGSGMEGLTTLLYLLLRDYKADRVTISEYVELDDGSALATCVAEVRSPEMRSVLDLQQTPISAELLAEIKRVDYQPGRWLYVPDAQAADVAVLRVAMIESGVWAAYYQIMPLPPKAAKTGKKIKLLAVSWQLEHPLSQQDLKGLYLSGVACGTVLLFMALKPTTKK